MTESNSTDQLLTPDAPAAERLPFIVARLRETHPDAHCALDYNEPWQLLVATIMSAQTTDERVNQVTPELFAEASREEVEALIQPTGFFRQKARYIQETCQRIVEEYGGEVPSEMEALLTMSGVARKTANVVLGEIYGVADGVVVDTHVKRVARRLARVEGQTPEQIEQELMVLLPRDLWIEISHLLIFHGRRICHAQTDCAHCPLASLCPSAVV